MLLDAKYQDVFNWNICSSFGAQIKELSSEGSWVSSLYLLGNDIGTDACKAMRLISVPI